MTNFDESPVTHSAMLQRLSGFFAVQYPFFDSGTIIVTSLMEGVFLLRKHD